MKTQPRPSHHAHCPYVLIATVVTDPDRHFDTADTLEVVLPPVPQPLLARVNLRHERTERAIRTHEPMRVDLYFIQSRAFDFGTFDPLWIPGQRERRVGNLAHRFLKSA